MGIILLVDDDKDYTALLRHALGKDGHRVVVANSGKEALGLLGLEPGPGNLKPDLAILDVMMPVMDGFTLNSRLQADERTRDIPVLVLTARGAMGPLFQDAPNVRGCICKPVELGALRDTVRRALVPPAP